jgi:hypothetical protein
MTTRSVKAAEAAVVRAALQLHIACHGPISTYKELELEFHFACARLAALRAKKRRAPLMDRDRREG